MNEKNKEKYNENTRRTVDSMFWKQSNEDREDDLHKKLYKRIIKITTQNNN